MILIKMGGSVITNKARPLSPRRKAMDGLAGVLGRLGQPVAVVHGGGSYGHYWSVRYGMHTREARYGLRGVSVVKNSMIELNKMVLDSMARRRQAPYCLPPTDFMRGSRPVPSKIREIGAMARAGLIPVTFGDALWCGGGRTYILSGDRIMAHLARVLRPRLCVFALDGDGLYSDPESGELVREMDGRKVAIGRAGMDVTGGMARKVEEATRMARLGLDVFFVNGNRPERIVKAVKSAKFEGTLFRGKKHGR